VSGYGSCSPASIPGQKASRGSTQSSRRTRYLSILGGLVAPGQPTDFRAYKRRANPTHSGQMLCRRTGRFTWLARALRSQPDWELLFGGARKFATDVVTVTLLSRRTGPSRPRPRCEA